MGTNAIRKSAEHHFLTTIADMRQNAAGWKAVHFDFSGDINHDDMNYDPEGVLTAVQQQRGKATAFFDTVVPKLEALGHHYAYLFTDNDIVILIQDKDGANAALTDILHSGKQAAGTDKVHLAALQQEIYSYQKMADEKFLSARRLQAYDVMSDKNKISSIAVRRERRGFPLVQVVEDDRFTAAYATNILGKNYELVISRSGEDAIIDYVENAPDIVFMDIHLPGMNGHQTLHTIRAMDKDVYAYMLSVDTKKDNIREAKNCGAQGFLKKPFSKERIIQTVKTSPHIMRSSALAAASQ